MLRYCLAFFLLLPALAIAQIKITGQVLDMTTKKPVANASVFITNTTIGTKADDNGQFTLWKVKQGSYDLVISIIGYETYSFKINAGIADIDLKGIEIIPKSILLNEVKIKPDPNWENNYMIFKREFLGRYATECKILNPKVIDLRYDAETRQLIASSYDFIEIENKKLGYKLKYLLHEFVKDNVTNVIFYAGSVLFEEMKGSASKKRRWQKARSNAYLGSSQHFLRSTLSAHLEEEGFKALRLIRTPNPLRPPDSLIKAKLSYLRKVAATATFRWGDSISYWASKSSMPKMTQTLVTTPLQVNDFAKLTDQPGRFALKFKDCLYVIYTKKNSGQINSITDKPLNAPDYPTSIVVIKNDYALFDYNGVFINPGDTLFEGDWGANRTGDLLPVDYEEPKHK
jgi:hypothetical protein